MENYARNNTVKRLFSLLIAVCFVMTMAVVAVPVFAAQVTSATLTLTLEDSDGNDVTDLELYPGQVFDMVVTLEGLAVDSKVYSLAVNVIYSDLVVEPLATAGDLKSANATGITYDSFLDDTTPDVFEFSTPSTLISGGPAYKKGVKLLWVSTDDPYDGSGFDGSNIELMRVPFVVKYDDENTSGSDGVPDGKADTVGYSAAFEIDKDGEETMMAYGATSFYTLTKASEAEADIVDVPLPVLYFDDPDVEGLDTTDPSDVADLLEMLLDGGYFHQEITPFVDTQEAGDAVTYAYTLTGKANGTDVDDIPTLDVSGAYTLAVTAKCGDYEKAPVSATFEVEAFSGTIIAKPAISEGYTNSVPKGETVEIDVVYTGFTGDIMRGATHGQVIVEYDPATYDVDLDAYASWTELGGTFAASSAGAGKILLTYTSSSTANNIKSTSADVILATIPFEAKSTILVDTTTTFKTEIPFGGELARETAINDLFESYDPDGDGWEYYATAGYSTGVDVEVTVADEAAPTYSASYLEDGVAAGSWSPTKTTVTLSLEDTAGVAAVKWATAAAVRTALGYGATDPIDYNGTDKVNIIKGFNGTGTAITTGVATQDVNGSLTTDTYKFEVAVDSTDIYVYTKDGLGLGNEGIHKIAASHIKVDTKVPAVTADVSNNTAWNAADKTLKVTVVTGPSGIASTGGVTTTGAITAAGITMVGSAPTLDATTNTYTYTYQFTTNVTALTAAEKYSVTVKSAAGKDNTGSSANVDNIIVKVDKAKPTLATVPADKSTWTSADYIFSDISIVSGRSSLDGNITYKLDNLTSVSAYTSSVLSPATLTTTATVVADGAFAEYVTLYLKNEVGTENVIPIKISIDRKLPTITMDTPPVDDTDKNNGNVDINFIAKDDASGSGIDTTFGGGEVKPGKYIFVSGSTPDATITTADFLTKYNGASTGNKGTFKAVDGTAANAVTSLTVTENGYYYIVVYDNAGNQSAVEEVHVTALDTLSALPTLYGRTAIGADPDDGIEGYGPVQDTTVTSNNGTFMNIMLKYVADVPGAYKITYSINNAAEVDWASDDMVEISAANDYSFKVFGREAGDSTTDGTNAILSKEYNFSIVDDVADILTIRNNNKWFATDFTQYMIAKSVTASARESFFYEDFAGGYYAGDLLGEMNYDKDTGIITKFVDREMQLIQPEDYHDWAPIYRTPVVGP